MSIEETSFQLILHGGNARSSAMEAIQLAKSDDFTKADESIKAAREEIVKAHHIQTNLIQEEARGNSTIVTLLLVHAQDHLMNAMTVIDMAQEIIDVHRKYSLTKS